jgi:hypothetical protein
MRDYRKQSERSKPIFTRLNDLASEWKRMLLDNCSLVMTLGSHLANEWRRLNPFIRNYYLRSLDDLGFNLAQRFYYHSQVKVPTLNG